MRGVNAPRRKTCIIDTHKTNATVVGFRETKKECMSHFFLGSLVGHRIFNWYSLPAQGSARGITVGVDSDIF